MKQTAIKFFCSCILLLVNADATAQIFSGIDSYGTVMLSDFSTAETRTVIVEDAPLRHVPGVVPEVIRSKAVTSAFKNLISEASQQFALPAALIKSVIHVESNFNPNAKSPKGAQGLMQLMPHTAKRFGTTNAMDPRENIMAGARYLRWLLDHFNQDLELTIAAYNAGEGAVSRAGGKVPRIPETQIYLLKVLQKYKQILEAEIQSGAPPADVGQ